MPTKCSPPAASGTPSEADTPLVRRPATSRAIDAYNAIDAHFAARDGMCRFSMFQVSPKTLRIVER